MIANGREEEIVFVLGGSGLLWQDGATCELRPGDCAVHNGPAAHTLVGGEGCLDVLVFGLRLAPEGGYLPRSRNLWVAAWAVRTLDRHPWDDEAALGPPEIPALGERPPNVRAGNVLAFPPGAGVAHFVRTDTGMTYLAYGTRSPADICFYPFSNKIAFRGAGLMARLEHLDYFDGEP